MEWHSYSFSKRFLDSFQTFKNIFFLCVQEKRIYDLKKKNQELEKFKFVLDYKIKELKKQIEPRENDIKEMKEQIQEVFTYSIVYFIIIDQIKDNSKN